MRRIYLIIYLLLLIPALLVADNASVINDLSEWYSSHPRAQSYQGIWQELTDLLLEAQILGLPRWVLMERLLQGAARRVRPDILLKELIKEKERLITADGILKGSSAHDKDRKTYETHLKNISIYLRAGLQETTLEQLLSFSMAAHKPVEMVFQVCAVLAQILSKQNIEKTDVLRLGKEILSSKLNPEKYDDISSFFLRASAKRMRVKEIISIITENLERGGNLIQLEQELIRRTGRE